MQQLIFSVGKIASYIKNIFDNETLLQGISISGEVSGVSRAGTTLYFTLKDSEAQLNCVCFIADMLAYNPKNGDKCVVKGSVSYYKKGGRLNFSVTDVRLTGDGDQYIKLLMLKEKLTLEGLFDPARKKPLPPYPQKTAIITSLEGAVIHDILKIHTQCAPFTDIAVYPVRVQGSFAARDICEAVQSLSGTDCDVIIIARGGGSAEDLSQYNDEQLARRVAASKIPIVSAVGHENDYTLCDLAADARASTPTNAADMLFGGYRQYRGEIRALSGGILSKVSATFLNGAGDVQRTMYALFSHWEHYFSAQRLEVISAAHSAALSAEYRLGSSILEIEGITRALKANDPLKVLDRGFALIYSNGVAAGGMSGLKPGSDIKVRMKDGCLRAKITDVTRGDFKD